MHRTTNTGINRRNVLKSVAAAAAGSMFAPSAAFAAGSGQEIVKPRRLRPGQTIGLVAPASNAGEDEQIHVAIEIIESLGYRVRQGKYLFERNQYLAGLDQERAADVNGMFADPDVDAVFCLRGGYGTPRILPYLDYDLIADNPKVLLGYSDITGILTAIHSKTGLVGFHGPIAMRNFPDYTLEEFRKVLERPSAPVHIGAPPPFEGGPGKVDMHNRLTRISGGRARGRLLGGNLTLLCSLLGTEYEPDFRDRILFLEDVGEAPYRIDRMLTQLLLARRLQSLAGIAFGKFTETGTIGNTFSIEEVLRNRCGGLDMPVVRGFMIGHVDEQTVVPIGIEAELDGDAATLQLLDTAVV